MTATAPPRVLHAVPGRVRIHAPEPARGAPGRVEERLRSLPGVTSVRAGTATGNVLVCFDPAALERGRVLDALADVSAAPGAGPEQPAGGERPAGPSAVLRHDAGPHGRARIAVSGLDRDPQLAVR